MMISDVSVSSVGANRMQMTAIPFSANLKLILRIYHLLLPDFGALHISGRWGLGVEDERNPQRKTHFEV